MADAGLKTGWRAGLLAAPALYLVLAALMALSCTLGFVEIPVWRLLEILAEAAGMKTAAADPAEAAIVLQVRLPRIAAAALVGGTLAVSGTVFQALLLNPLADPYTLGISSGAAFGASAAIVLTVLGIHIPQGAGIPAFAFIGAMGSLFAVMALASGSGGTAGQRLSSTNLILAGVIVSAILSAAIGFMKFLADEQVGAIIFWLMGSLSGVYWHQAAMLAAVSLPCILVVQLFGQELNIAATGEKTAQSLGIDTARLRLLLLTLCSLWTAAAVSISGIIGFVGLIVPHLLRRITGPDNRLLAAAAFPAGAILLLAADTITRAVLPAEVPIGVLTALIGGPFFCLIFRRTQGGRGF